MSSSQDVTIADDGAATVGRVVDPEIHLVREVLDLDSHAANNRCTCSGGRRDSKGSNLAGEGDEGKLVSHSETKVG